MTDGWGWFNGSPIYWDTSTSSSCWTTITAARITSGYIANDPSESVKPGPLAWLDERVDEIEEMGREMMEAA